MNFKKESEKKYRWALMCNDQKVNAWAFTALEQLVREPGQEMVALIVNTASNDTNLSLPKKILNYPYKHFLFRFYKRFLLGNKNVYGIKAVGQLFYPNTYSIIECTTDKKKYDEYFSEGDIIKINNLRLDFIVKMGFGIIKGPILDSAKYGVWSYHHDDEQIIRGGPHGFWEIYFHHLHNGVLLQQITNRLDAGKLLEKIILPVVWHSYKYQTYLILKESAFMLRRCFIKLKQDPQYFENLPDIRSAAPIYKFPTNFFFLRFIIKLIVNKISFHFKEIFYTEFWKLCLVNQPIDAMNSLKSNIPCSKWVSSNNKSAYLADPFVYSYNKKNYLLAEEYNYNSKKAHIVRFEETNPGTKENCIDEPFHLSYPYIFNDTNGKIYCIPESTSNNCIRLYALNPDNNSFAFKKKLIDNFPATDSSIVFFDNKYWLFCTRREECLNTHLYLFYSSELEGNYISHKRNPIVSNIHSARPGGSIFLTNNQLIRPAQDCSATYGWKLKFMEITHLSTNDYSEKEIMELGPEAFEHSKGIHTISGNNMITIIDTKYYRFCLVNTYSTIRKKIKKLFS